MSSTNFFTANICLTDLLEAQAKGHSSFNTAENGKVYVNLFGSEKSEVDKYNNTHSLRLNSKKDFRNQEQTAFVGNARLTPQ